MQKNKLVKIHELDFMTRLTVLLAPADETVFRNMQEAGKSPSGMRRRAPEPHYTARHLGSI